MALILSRHDVQRLLSMEACIDALEPAHIAFSHRRAIMPVRLTASFHDQGVMAVMPAWLDEGPKLGVKCVTSFPGNVTRHLLLVAGTVLLLDARTGMTMAVMDGSYITEIRTAAASALASRLLARVDASRLVLIGTGVQARAHLAAIAAVRPLTTVKVVGRTLASAKRFVESQALEFPELDLHADESADAAVAWADIVAPSARPWSLYSPPTVYPQEYTSTALARTAPRHARYPDRRCATRGLSSTRAKRTSANAETASYQSKRGSSGPTTSPTNSAKF